MSFVVFLGLGLGAITLSRSLRIAWGLKATEEVAQLSGAIIGAVLLIWGLRV